VSDGAAFARTAWGAARDTVHRVVVDGSSEQWDVYELPANGAPHDRPSLVFESPEAVRRVRDFPTDWRRLSDAELYAVSWRR
jgi:hypothetical protein